MGPVSVTPSPGPKRFATPKGQGGRFAPVERRNGGRLPLLFPKRRLPTLSHFLFDYLVSQQEVAQLLALA